MTRERDRWLPWIVAGCVFCLAASFVLIATALSKAYDPPPGTEAPKVTDWMQGWGSIAGVVAGLAAAGAASWLLLHERQQAREAREQLHAEQAEIAMRPARSVFTSSARVRQMAGSSSVAVQVWNLGLRPVLDARVYVIAPEGEVYLGAMDIIRPGAEPSFEINRRHGIGLNGLTEQNAGEAPVVIRFSEPTRERWRRTSNGEPERT